MAELQTDKTLIENIEDNIFSNPGTLIVGDMDQDLRIDDVYSKANVDMLTKLFREYNSHWVCKGSAWPARSTPSSPANNDAYLVLEAGTVFGESCSKYDILYYSGGWVRASVNLNDYYYTKSEVDALIAAVGGGGGSTVDTEKKTGVTLTAMLSTTVTHSLNNADFILQIMDAAGRDYTSSFNIVSRSTANVIISNGSSVTFTNMKILLISF